jgi:hypothetical protein
MTRTEKDQATPPIEAVIAFLLQATRAYSRLTPTKKEEAACIVW